MPNLSVPIPGLEEAIQQRNAQLAAAESKPLVPGWLVALAAALVPVAALGNLYLPSPLSEIAGILAFVAGILGGVALPQLRFSHPLIPLALVPLAMTGALWLNTLAASLTSPVAHLACILGSGVLAFLAGKPLPAPQVPSAPQQ